ncbi:sensor histidine kinase [Planctomycetota bacterium]
MEPVPENIRLLKGAYWLTKLRWIAIVYVVIGTYVAGNILTISLHEVALYIIATLLILYNITVLILLKRLEKNDPHVSCKAVKRIINFQICTDLFLLTMILHYSGGIENPLVFYFVFHMIISSILLSPRESYLQVAFAVLLFGLLALLEHTQLIAHHCLTGFVPHCLQEERLYVLGTLFVFTTALFLAVYMANYITIRLKKTEEAYRQANIMLQQKDRIKDEYVFRVTHDIKGHLATIQSCLAIVVDGIAGKREVQEADLMGRAYKRTLKLSDFVRALLKLTKMRLSNTVERDDFSLVDALQNTIETVKNRADEKSISLNYKIEPSTGTIFGNQFSIEEMVVNLLLNAIKYTPENGTVGLKASGQEDSILVEVTDTGIGIPQEEQSRIFDEFFRATNARKVEWDGTGLGLSIVKLIVDGHNGEMSVKSSGSGGTTFIIRLPRGRVPQAGEVLQKDI